jgi:DNA polymerase III subunit delta
MAELKPAYLIHGDDHGAVAERRAGLRALAESEEGAGVEVLDGDAASPAGVAVALSVMTLAVGQRVIIVEGAERWREADVTKHLEPALAQMPPQTTLALFAREEGRAKVPASVHALIKRAGGQIVAQMTVKPWELAKWAREQGARMGLALDAAAAKALVAQVGDRQQRLLRELEKLALEGEQSGSSNQPRRVEAEEIEARAARSAEWRAYGLADALAAADGAKASITYLRLCEQGERLSGLSYLMAGRLREALSISLRLSAGESVAEVKRGLRMPAKAAERLVADVARSDPAKLRGALIELGELELNLRGGAPLLSARTVSASMSEDTLAQRAFEAISA